jgi:hypothetical protein
MNGEDDRTRQRLEPSFLLGETPAESLRNIDSVLQVLADATQAPAGSESVSHGHWLILQELAAIARKEAARLDQDGAHTR